MSDNSSLLKAGYSASDVTPDRLLDQGGHAAFRKIAILYLVHMAAFTGGGMDPDNRVRSTDRNEARTCKNP